MMQNRKRGRGVTQAWFYSEKKTSQVIGHFTLDTVRTTTAIQGAVPQLLCSCISLKHAVVQLCLCIHNTAVLCVSGLLSFDCLMAFIPPWTIARGGQIDRTIDGSIDIQIDRQWNGQRDTRCKCKCKCKYQLLFHRYDGEVTRWPEDKMSIFGLIWTSKRERGQYTVSQFDIECDC